jgi:hypothetical protein
MTESAAAPAAATPLAAKTALVTRSIPRASASAFCVMGSSSVRTLIMFPGPPEEPVADTGHPFPFPDTTATFRRLARGGPGSCTLTCAKEGPA